MSEPAAEKYTAVNVARLIYSAVFLAGMFAFEVGHLWPFGAGHLLFSLVWWILIEREILVEARHSWTGYPPAALDVAYVTILIYVTGNVQSFLILSYLAYIVLSSLAENPGFGRFTALFSGVTFATMAALVGFDFVESVNIFGSPQKASAIEILLAALYVPSGLLTLQVVFRGPIERLHAEIKRRRDREETIRRELELARRVQESFLPRRESMPSHGRLGFESRYLAMESVGGDTFDIVRITDTSYGIFIGDVAGHGVGAAMVTAMLQATFRSLKQDAMDATEVVRELNRRMFMLIGDLHTYVTLYYLRADLATDSIEYVNAGHQPALLIRDGELCELDTERSFFVGVLEDHDYVAETLRLNQGDRILLFTDGIVETRRADGSMYGDDDMNRYLQNNLDGDLKRLVEGLMEDAAAFGEGRPPQDDRAIVALELRGSDHRV